MDEIAQKPKEFHLDFSNRVIEHLGIKLYQNRPTNVVAEFVSNSWDADASKVTIDLQEEKSDIIITDNGMGMTRDELTDAFLVIGHNKRITPQQKTHGGRSPMGRKGIGKLAGFGIARVIDIVSIPNRKMRSELADSTDKVFWLRFRLKDMLKSNHGYSPIVIADGVSISEFKTLIETHELSDVFKNISDEGLSGGGGVSIYLHETSLKRTINPASLLQALGGRFTVTLLRPDFEVSVNEKKITIEDALPPFQAFGFGSISEPITEVITLGDTEREVRFWVRFVSLADAEWPLENAGVGVYAHGKIAQDRPFFFGVRGKEIFSRYLYGVIEADWLDEMPEDVVSTDRRSVNWNTDQTAAFYEWGAKKLSEWVDGFRRWRSAQPVKETVERIRAASNGTLSGTEEEALAKLLNEVLPSFGNNEEIKNKTTLSFTPSLDSCSNEGTHKITLGTGFCRRKYRCGTFSKIN